MRRLQGELLVLGLLSLLLVAFEPYLLRICIPCSGSCSWDCPAPSEGGGASNSNSSAAGDGGHRRLHGLAAATAALLGAGGGGASGTSGWAAGSGRLLLSSDAALDAYSCYQASETCGLGSEPFWSQLAIIQVGTALQVWNLAQTALAVACRAPHWAALSKQLPLTSIRFVLLPRLLPSARPLSQSHVFLFLIALIQIAYACASMLLCLWKVRRGGRTCSISIAGRGRAALHNICWPRCCAVAHAPCPTGPAAAAAVAAVRADSCGRRPPPAAL